MVQIAINEKKLQFTTKEALRIHGETYQVHEELRSIGKTGVPVIFHRGRVYDGCNQCIKFIDYEFEPFDVLMPIKNSVDMNEAVEFIHEEITHPFYKMLLRQTEDLQEKEKKRIMDNAYIISQQVKMPFFNGEQFTIADITIAPYFERMQVLEYYRNFKIPDDGDRYAKWHEWKKNVLSRESVKDSLQKDQNKLLSAYERYAKGIVRNNWYKRIEEEDQKAREDYLKPLPPRFQSERKKWMQNN